MSGNEVRYDVFLSHNSKDKEKYILPLKKRLEESKLKAFVDVDNLYPGQNFVHELTRAVRSSHAAAFCIGAEEDTGWIKKELGIALGEEQARQERNGNSYSSVIPVLLPGKPTDLRDLQHHLDDALRNRNWINFRGGFDVPNEFGRFAHAIQRARIAAPGVFKPGSQIDRSLMNLVILCDRQDQVDEVKDAFLKALEEKPHRPLVVIIKGEEKQKPRVLVERILYDVIPTCLDKDRLVFPKSINFEAFNTQTAGGRELILSRDCPTDHLTRELAFALKKHPFRVDASSTLPEIISELNHRQSTFLFEIQLYVDASSNLAESALRHLLSFLSDKHFQKLEHPFVVCLEFSNLQITSGRPETNVLQRLWNQFASSWRKPETSQEPSAAENGNRREALSEFQASINLVDPPRLENVRREHVIRWANHDKVRDRCPTLYRTDFDLALGSWPNPDGLSFEKAEPPLQELIRQSITEPVYGNHTLSYQ